MKGKSHKTFSRSDEQMTRVLETPSCWSVCALASLVPSTEDG